jgi:hypothetical protein
MDQQIISKTRRDRCMLFLAMQRAGFGARPLGPEKSRCALGSDRATPLRHDDSVLFPVALVTKLVSLSAHPSGTILPELCQGLVKPASSGGKIIVEKPPRSGLYSSRPAR